MPTWSIADHNQADKHFVISGPEISLFVDYDDVDHALVDRTTEKLVEVLNKNWVPPKDYLKVSDKYDTYEMHHPDGAEGAALELLEERQNEGYWYYDEDGEKAEAILQKDDGAAALAFLRKRSDYEYEYVEVRRNT